MAGRCSFGVFGLVLWGLLLGNAALLRAETVPVGAAACGEFVPPAAGTVKIVVGSSLLADIVLDLVDGKASVLTMVPGSSCPGHETVKTTDLLFAAHADLILVHAFQRELPWLSALKGAMQDGRGRVLVAETEGSWLVPAVQKEAVRDVAARLAETFPAWRDGLLERAGRRLSRVESVERTALDRLAPLRGAVVAASEMQAELVRWAGFEVAVTFGRPEAMQPLELVRQTELLRRKQAVGVVDNLQSGADAGLPLAAELGVPHVVLSNFPGFREDVPDYDALLCYNVGELLKLGTE